MMMFGPPFIVTKEQIDEMIALFDEVLSAVETRIGF
jgi:adenosylmethionine-8-amino-7-oxononanoate aminotransferase